MEFEWDEAKAASNLAKHGVGFETVREFDWESAIVVPDQRRDYGEPRWVAYGVGRDNEMYVVAFTIRAERYRVISVRLFGRKEYKLYGR